MAIFYHVSLLPILSEWLLWLYRQAKFLRMSTHGVTEVSRLHKNILIYRLVMFYERSETFDTLVNIKKWDICSLSFLWLFSVEKNNISRLTRYSGPQKYKIRHVKREIWDKRHTWILKKARLWDPRSSTYDLNNEMSFSKNWVNNSNIQKMK